MPTTSPFSTPRSLQRVGQPLGVAQQVGVGDVALLALLAAPVEGDAVPGAGLDVAVEAVVRDVQLAALEPLVEGRVRSRRGPVSQRSNQSRSRGLLSPPGDGIARLPPRASDSSLIAARLDEVLRRIEALLVEQVPELALEVRRLVRSSLHVHSLPALR